CVACGAPLVDRVSERASPVGPTVHSQMPPPRTAPAPAPDASMAGYAPPSATLPFAETASPSTRESAVDRSMLEAFRAANPAPYEPAPPARPAVHSPAAVAA